MKTTDPVPAAPATLLLLGLTLAAFSTTTVGATLAQTADATAAEEPTIEEAIQAASPLVREYNDHLSFLGHPFLDGRIPGSRGMEIAKDYVEDHFRAAGLQPAYVDASGNPSFRQDFPISTQSDLVSQAFSVGSYSATPGTDFTGLSIGGSGTVTGEAVFVGYSIERGSGGYSSYAEGDDLHGKIAVMFRFEPMNEDGSSQWNERGWSARAGFARKVGDAVDRGAAGVLIVNPPGCADERAESLPLFSSSGRSRVDVPVACLSISAGEALVRAAGPQGKDLLALRKEADAGRVFLPLRGTCTLSVISEEKELVGQNVSGLIPGRGALANEIVVVGAHLDHLGMGQYGSRGFPGELHPGADDNASGSAAMIMLGERFVKWYAEQPEDANLRTLLIQCYDAEEAGLVGSFYYSRNPIRPIEDHVLMLNFDMIGRIVDRKLAVSGLDSARGLKEWVEPYLAASPLDVVRKGDAPAASDHWPFYQAGVPVLFAICEPLHADYHTPRDTVDKINRVDAVRSMLLWEDIARAMIVRPERFEYAGATRQGSRTRERDDEAQAPPPSQEPPATGGGPAGSRVRLGIQPVGASYDPNWEDGVEVESVTADSPAAKAGLQIGDNMIKWGGKELKNAADLGAFLREHEPGDKVEIVVVRDGAEVTLTVELAERG
ncbi:MAG: M28 family peptidase [Planctomycetota bacterium]